MLSFRRKVHFLFYIRYIVVAVCVKELGRSHGARIDYLVKDMIRESDGKDAIHMSEAALSAMGELRKFMFENVYLNENVKKASDLQYVENIISSLYNYFCEYPSKLPQDLYELTAEYSVEEMVKDHVAGMTDRFAINLYNDLFMPKGW